jgi:hypothetical protein
MEDAAMSAATPLWWSALRAHVRYGAHFGLISDIARLPRRAKLRLMHRSKQALIKSLRGKRAAGEKRVDSFLRNAPVGEGGT